MSGFSNKLLKGYNQQCSWMDFLIVEIIKTTMLENGFSHC